MKITQDQFAQMSSVKDPTQQVQWVESINNICPKYGIDTPARMEMFMAQCAHESDGFTALVENLNYNTNALQTIFKKYFNSKQAAVYARQPEKIANIVYANRMGNGPTESGDGWKFRGRGVLQITGKNNYSKFATHLMLSLDDTVAYLGTKDGAIEGACWFFKVNNLLHACDAKDVLAATKIINGGTIGKDDRVARYKKAEHLFA